MAATFSLGLDIGTTTISAVVADTASKAVLASRTQKHDADITSDRPKEKIQSPERIEGIAKALVNELLDTFPGIGSIGITGQMHGILYLNREGVPVSPLYTWQDQQSADLCPQLTKQTGYVLSPGYGLATHCALVKANAVPEDAWKVCTIMDYLAYVLCGKKQLLMHATNAASLGFFCLEDGQFDRKALCCVGIAPELLPCVTWDTACVGTYRDIPVAVTIGDNQASFLGSVPSPKNMALANFGTGSQISRMVEKLPHISGNGTLEVRPFLKGQYLLCGSALCGGRAYALLEQFFRSFTVRCGMPEDSRYDVLNALAAEGLALEDLPDIQPTFCGTRADATLRGQMQNISEANFTPAAFTAGLLLGMAKELHGMFQIMPHREVTGLVASGNGARKNPALPKALQKVFSLPVTVPACREEAAFGAALFGAEAAKNNPSA